MEWRNGGRGSEREPGGGIEREGGAGQAPPTRRQAQQTDRAEREREGGRERIKREVETGKKYQILSSFCFSL